MPEPASRKGPAQIIGVVGTAKNTGKTTALLSIVRYLETAGRRAGITGIGYDGEHIDNLTLLPKPRMEFPAGALVATAERCLKNATLQCRLLLRTGVMSPLGEVLILEVTSRGRIVVAGPNQRVGLTRIIEGLGETGSEVSLVDGALGRLAPMSVADGVVFATGAARSTSLARLATEMNAIYRLFNLPQYGEKSEVGHRYSNILLRAADGTWTDTGVPALLDEGQAEALCERAPSNVHTVILPGLVIARALERLFSRLRRQSKRVHLVLANPLVALLAGEPEDTCHTVRRIEERGGKVNVLRPVTLHCVAVNPFYPRRHSSGLFKRAYVDRRALRDRVAKAVPVTVVDVKANGPETLVQACRLTASGV